MGTKKTLTKTRLTSTKEVSVTANRKKPRLTSTNRQNVKEVWGDAHTKEIDIPQFIIHTRLQPYDECGGQGRSTYSGLHLHDEASVFPYVGSLSTLYPDH